MAFPALGSDHIRPWVITGIMELLSVLWKRHKSSRLAAPQEDLTQGDSGRTREHRGGSSWVRSCTRSSSILLRMLLQSSKGCPRGHGTHPAPPCVYLGLGAPGIHGVLCIQGLGVLELCSHKGIQAWDAAGAAPHRLQSPIPRFSQREGAHPIPLRSRWTPSAGSPGTKALLRAAAE